MTDETSLTAATAGALYRLKPKVRRALAASEVGHGVVVHVTWDRGRTTSPCRGLMVAVAEQLGGTLADVVVLETRPGHAVAISLATITRIERT